MSDSNDPILASLDPLNNEAGADAMAILHECRQRVLEREGIPMFVALADRRPGRRLAVTDPATVAEGRRLADLFVGYDRALEALGYPVDLTDPDPDETGARELIDSLVVLSDQHLRRAKDLA